ncbi:hypothetical protein ACHAXA_004339 [Cyclostephanos tholiformis]|uniref:Uncharacterized protein n=1 Tax=Cyclostephanos tholiformis TaxID=382380 RepID=A0ABD3SPH7_9STRA
MLRKLTFAFVGICWDVQCRAFKRSERSSLIISTIREGGLHVHTLKRHFQIFSIRGGGDDDDKNELDDNAAYLQFITSFESELAEIRREAEMEAKYEMEKLLRLFQHEDEVKPGKSAVATYNVNESTTEPVDQSKIESDENLPSDGEIIYQHVIESYSEVGADDKNLHDARIKLDDKICKLSDLASESDDVATVPSEVTDVRIVDSTTIKSSMSKPKGGMKSKTLKRKAKGSKKEKKDKERTIFYEDMESSGVGDHVVDGDSITLTRMKIDDVALTKQSGIFVFIRSDLGRALGLFIATVLLAIITTRLQRQMEEAVTDQTMAAK